MTTFPKSFVSGFQARFGDAPEVFVGVGVCVGVGVAGRFEFSFLERSVDFIIFDDSAELEPESRVEKTNTSASTEKKTSIACTFLCFFIQIALSASEGLSVTLRIRSKTSSACTSRRIWTGGATVRSPYTCRWTTSRRMRSTIPVSSSLVKTLRIVRVTSAEESAAIDLRIVYNRVAWDRSSTRNTRRRSRHALHHPVHKSAVSVSLVRAVELLTAPVEVTVTAVCRLLIEVTVKSVCASGCIVYRRIAS